MPAPSNPWGLRSEPAQLGGTELLTFDARQAALAKAAGLKVKP